MKLVRGEVSAVLQAGVCLKSVSGDGRGIRGWDVGEQRDIKSHHDVVRLEGDVFQEVGKLLRVLDMMNGVAHQGLQNLGEVPCRVVRWASSGGYNGS